jgi:hypothetical protein
MDAEAQFATTLIVRLKAGVALLVSAGTVFRRWTPAFLPHCLRRSTASLKSFSPQPFR